MRTQSVQQIEVRQLESLAQRYREELRAAEARLGQPLVPPADPADPNPFVRHLMTLPFVTVRSPESMFSDRSVDHRIRIVRDIQVDLSTEPPRYRLCEESFELTPGHHLESVNGPLVVCDSENAAEVLEEGYDAISEDELLEKLWPIIETVETRETAEPTPEELAAVEKILGVPSLSQAERQRVREDIAGFLEGRLEPSEFIARAVQHDLPPPLVYEGTRESLHLRIEAPQSLRP